MLNFIPTEIADSNVVYVKMSLGNRCEVHKAMLVLQTIPKRRQEGYVTTGDPDGRLYRPTSEVG